MLKFKKNKYADDEIKNEFIHQLGIVLMDLIDPLRDPKEKKEEYEPDIWWIKNTFKKFLDNPTRKVATEYMGSFSDPSGELDHDLKFYVYKAFRKYYIAMRNECTVEVPDAIGKITPCRAAYLEGYKDGFSDNPSLFDRFLYFFTKRIHIFIDRRNGE